MKYIYAYTPPSYPYPPYINVSRDETTSEVRIMVRSPPNEDGSCGSVSYINLGVLEYTALLSEAVKEALTQPPQNG